MIMRIEPILLFVRDFERCLAFYRDVVGLRLKSEEDGYAEFDVGGTTFALHGGYEGEGRSRHGEGPLALHFWTEDIQATVKRLKDKGVKITREPEWMEFGAWEAAFEDPEGNEWGLVQEG